MLKGEQLFASKGQYLKAFLFRPGSINADYPSLLADHYAADGLAAAEPSGGDVGGVEAALQAPSTAA